MADDPTLGTLQRSVGFLLVAVVLAVAVALHALLPRYDWQPVTSDGRTIIVHDRWTNRFQRATFVETGRIEASDVYVTP